MNIAMLVADNAIKNQIVRLMSFMCGEEAKITSADEADLLISDRPSQLLEFLAAGKYACQILYRRDHAPLPKEADINRTERLRVYAFDDTDHIYSYPDMRSLVAYLAVLTLQDNGKPRPDGPHLP